VPFHHPAFFLLFLVTLVLYWGLPRRLQHAVLLASSLAFYYYAGLVDSLLLLGTVGANALLAWRLDCATGPARSRWLALAVVANLAVLGYWKYRGFVVDNLRLIAPGSARAWTAMVSPSGYPSMSSS
jgi:alginate O-acetyltransferase complex protein AlgI